ncbi:MAG: quinol:cytochrome C oxidoreductase [Bacteroidetes bacterium]|nr:quinol:cytochrome C oxidoreductase [Bacteroidota bacterium]
MTFGIMMLIGLVSIVCTFIFNSHQAWSNLLWANFFFMGIALVMVFFMAVQYVAEVGWSAMIMRVPEAMSQWLYVAMPIMLIIVLAGVFHQHHLWHWMDDSLYEEGGAHYDAIIAGKSGFLNKPFFIIRVLLYSLIWCGFAYYFRKRSLAEEEEGGVSIHKRNITLGAVFLVLFGISTSVMAWDFIMSIDTHWFSTLFGWYTFSGIWVSGLSMMAMIIVFLKRKNLLQDVTEHHLHDVGKFMFAFSVFWTYLWFSQFMLIWYSNLPEEVVYFRTRFEHYRWPVWIAFFLNFVFPFLILMTRDAKRKMNTLLIGGTIILCGHLLDNWNMITPGAMSSFGHHWQFSFMEVGTVIGFLGGFLYVTFNSLAKAKLVREKHPMMIESAQHSI